ncbi:MAG: nucleotidyltransferase domain-containing protein [Fimbriimonadaceae bacterium]|nr:nucleotidyltransferase domain-containing protein [Fimbriimonadaceae bacterium]
MITLDSRPTISVKDLPDGVQVLVGLIRKQAEPQVILLYGSRARGTARPESDWDLCVVGAGNASGMEQLLVDQAYDPPVLLPIDLVPYESVDPYLRAAIDRDGVRIVD